jgi:citrate lyase subunit beta / citryl-CoA lyase
VTFAERLLAARTLLFVPGHRPDRFDKAAASGADVVVLDLEDAVATDRKDEARGHVGAWLRQGHRAVVRINGTGSQWFEPDVAELGPLAAAVMLPKAESAAEVAQLPAGVPVLPLVETSLGVLRAAETCAVPAVVRPVFGSVDLAAELGVDHTSHAALRHARSSLVLAAAAARCGAPVDGVTTRLADEEALRRDTEQAVELGFTGKLCIHPRQVPLVHQLMAPTPEQVEWARAVLAGSGDGSAAAVNGEMIDRPVLTRARAVLSRAAPGSAAPRPGLSGSSPVVRPASPPEARK